MKNREIKATYFIVLADERPKMALTITHGRLQYNGVVGQVMFHVIGTCLHVTVLWFCVGKVDLRAHCRLFFKISVDTEISSSRVMKRKFFDCTAWYPTRARRID